MVAKVLTPLAGHATPALNRTYQIIAAEEAPVQIDQTLQLAPRYKIIQYSLEKLDLLLHKEMESEMYSCKKGTVPFVTAGYDRLQQDENNFYNGYTVDSYYQMLGTTHDYKGIKWFAALATAESYMTVTPYKSHASYTTVYGSLGGAHKHKRWHYGLNGLYGYSFLTTKKNIPFLNETAKTSHGAWTASADAKLSYKKKNGNGLIMPYESIGYIYGYENAYNEHGAPGANLHVHGEKLSQLRNNLGLYVDFGLTKYMKLFGDGSWVFEYYFNNNSYKANFIGSPLVGVFKQTLPARSYGRAIAGLEYHRKGFELKLTYNGLFGTRFAENGGSLHISQKY